MFKNIIRLIITSLLTIFLIASNALAFHKNGKSLIQENAKDGLTKKDLQSEYCTIKVQPDKIVEENKKTKISKKEKSIVKSEEKSVEERPKELDDELAKPKKIEKPKLKDVFKIESYHSKEIIEAPKVLDISVLKKMKMIGPETSIENLLSYYCLQEINDESIKQFKINKAIKNLYNKISEINGYVDENGKGDRNYSIDGEILKKGKIILDMEGAIIISKAKFIIDEENKIKKEVKKATDEAAATATAKRNNDEWISANKQEFLEKVRDKQNEYQDEIKALERDRDSIALLIKEYKDIFETAEGKLKILQTFDNHTQEIKSLKIQIIENGSLYLKDSYIRTFEKDFLPLSKINFKKKYDNYKNIDDLLARAEKSKSKKHFVGYKPFVKKKKIGFLAEFKNIKGRDLGAKRERSDIDILKFEINEEINAIEIDILNPFEDLQTFDNEYANKLPIKEIIIGLIILLVIAGFIFYHLSSRRKLNDAKNEAEERISNLKRDFDGQLRNTSDQIRSVSRVSRSQQSTQISEPPTVQEISKTPEEIISSQYDELVSEYKEALEDFSKVAAFKQKWHGLALSRKERQDGTKTILISSTRAFEKAEIWCLTFSDKYFAFPGSSVKSNMATYMNLDFEKASRDFKGVFAISSGSTYSTEPSVLRRGGAGFVVERVGTISFPN